VLSNLAVRFGVLRCTYRQQPEPGANENQLKMPGNLAVSGHFLQLWWPGTESNHRHADFQSAALPTELPGHEERKYIKGDYVAQVLFATFLL
jgi:hypothetical protein